MLLSHVMDLFSFLFYFVSFSRFSRFLFVFTYSIPLSRVIYHMHIWLSFKCVNLRVIWILFVHYYHQACVFTFHFQKQRQYNETFILQDQSHKVYDVHNALHLTTFHARLANVHFSFLFMSINTYKMALHDALASIQLDPWSEKKKGIPFSVVRSINTIIIY